MKKLLFIILLLCLSVNASAKTIRSQHDIEMRWILSHSTRCSGRLAWQLVRWADDKPYPALLLALMAAESSFNPCAISRTGAIGLGQISAVWIPELKRQGLISARRELFDPFVNLSCTNHILMTYIRRTKGNIRKALAKYLGKRSTWYINTVLANYGEIIFLLGGCEQ